MEWVTIDLTYQWNSIKIDVNGSTRYFEKADFSGTNRPLSIFTYSLAVVHVKSVLVDEPFEIETADPTERYSVEEIFYAEWGEGDRWINVTKFGRPLMERVIEMVGCDDPFLATNEKLQVCDPSPGHPKRLRLALPNGRSGCINERQKIIPAMAIPCDQFHMRESCL
jgi:hypothetical protein